MTTATRPRKRIAPMRALRAMRALLADPDDTAKVFEIIDALSGNAGERMYQRFVATAVGQQVLHERRDLLALLSDGERLRTMPTGSVGRTYAEFAAREQLSARGLLDANLAAGRRTDLGPDRRLFADRLRDMHDLWHVVTGYGRDLIGEAALLAFSFAQTRNPGVGFIVGVALLKAPDAATRRFILAGWRRGRRARWLPAEDWEALLEQPLARVREQLSLGEPPVYEPVRSAGAPAFN
jgi:ubiquinone biosynthesis protein COQ4